MARHRRGLDVGAARPVADRTAESLVRRIIGEVERNVAAQEISVNLADLHPAPWQPRRDYGEEEIAALAESIKREGLLQPLLVRPYPTRKGQYQVIFGHRRLEAIRRIARDREIGEGDYRLSVKIRECSDVEARLLTTVENLHRKGLSKYELARNVADVHLALKAARVPHGDRDLEPIFNMRAGSIAEYRVIGTTIREDLLREAGLTRGPDHKEIDWALVGELTKEQLYSAAKAKTDEAMVARLRRSAESARARTEELREGKRARPEVRAERPPRFTAEALWDRGGFAVKLSRPFRDYTADESRRFLADLLPAVVALSRNLADGGGQGLIENAARGLLTYMQGDSFFAETLQELSAFMTTGEAASRRPEAAPPMTGGGETQATVR